MARILHIEDDPKNRRLVHKLLTAAGHEVLEAESGLGGIRVAADAQPDLVLVDLHIPDLDGYEVTIRLRGIPSLAQVPIVAITAEGDRERSLAVGADGFIAKPIDVSSFSRTISRFLRGHRERATGRASKQLRLASAQIVQHLEAKVVELSEANARLEEMARLRREFLRNLSHELATPMTPIVGYLRLLLGEELGPLSPMQMKSLNSVQQSTERLRGLIDTLLDVSSLETGRMHFYTREYDFGRVAARALDMTRPRFQQRDLELHVEPARPGLMATGDGEKLRRAMVHVFDNAAKFTPPGGQVAVAIEAQDSDGDARYELRVADSGPGVAPSQVPRILDAFYQVDGSVTRHHGGVGLGLAFARRVSEAMGGSVQIHSPPVHEVAGCSLRGTEVVLRVRAKPQPRPEA